MLSISRKSDYALVAVAELAAATPERLSARDLAERCGVALPVLRNLLKALARAEILESTIGAFGGYRLMRRAGEISVLEVIEAIDGPVTLLRCCSDRDAMAELGGEGEAGDDPRRERSARRAVGDGECAPAGCDIQPSCRIARVMRGLSGRIVAMLDAVSIEDHAGVESVEGGVERKPFRLAISATRSVIARTSRSDDPPAPRDLGGGHRKSTTKRTETDA